MVEKVQRRFSKRVLGLFALCYGERREILQLDTLEQRRLTNDLVYCYKLMNGLVDSDKHDFFAFSSNNNHDHDLRGHSCKLVVPKTNRDCRKFAFSSRVVPVWNSLPQEAVDCNSVSSFKRTVSSLDFSPFLRFRD